jgi:hypothetical protein
MFALEVRTDEISEDEHPLRLDKSLMLLTDVGQLCCTDGVRLTAGASQTAQ